MKLVFASSNENKVAELRAVLPAHIELVSLNDLGFTDDIPETAHTLEGNALLKARHIATRYDVNCFADDTGLEVEALNGAPGVYSARYAGPQRSDKDNMQKLLAELAGKPNRNARFRTVIALIMDGKEYLFEGIVHGEIVHEPTGTNGFGYDPLFEPENCGKTFAEQDMQEKNSRSHRARAVKKLVDFLHNPQ
jgi:XTP/dITP diphosphohydrolase